MSLRPAYLLMLLLLLAACRESAVPETDPNAGIDRGGVGGIDRGGVSRGVITGFGSVYVNGIEYDTAAANIVIDNRRAIEEQLRVGQVVTVRGGVDEQDRTGIAAEVDYDTAIGGPVELVDVGARKLRILGQMVRVTAATRFGAEFGSLAGIDTGVSASISGYSDAAGTVVATRIDAGMPAGLEISGNVSVLDPAAMTFQVNGQGVSYSGASLTQFPGGAIAAGQYVEVRASAIGPFGRLVASEVEFHDARLPGVAGDAAAIEGVVTRLDSSSDFDVAGQPVITGSATRFEYGLASDVAPGLVLAVVGRLGVDGVLAAERIIMQPEPTLTLAATAGAIDVAGQVLTLLGVPVQVTERTSFVDGSTAALRAFSLSDVAVGDYLEVRAFAADDALIAVSVDRADPAAVEIAGTVAAIHDNGIEVLGVLVQTTPETVIAAGSIALSEAGFYELVQPGMSVQATGVVIGDGLIVASSLLLPGVAD